MCQEKFQTVDYRRFGVSRIARAQPSHPGFRNFAAGTGAERAMVAETRDAGWDAVLYVAGRQALKAALPTTAALGSVDAPADRALPPGMRYGQRVLSDAAILTGTPTHTALPAQGELLSQAVRAFAAFERGPSYHFIAGRWSVTARPVRAEKAECVNCHQRMDGDPSLRAGDVLGVAMYVFARSDAR
jgi:hypothetical protein